MPLYIFYGQDTFSLREAVDQLRQRLDADGSLWANTVSLDGVRLRPQELLEACQATPFLGPHRLVLVRGLLGRFQGEGRRRPQALGPWQSLAEALPGMPASTHLVLVEEGPLDASNPLLSLLRPHAQVQEFSPISGQELTRWLARRCRHLGLRLSDRAAALLLQLLGNDLWALASELEKLAVYANGQMVREADVRLLVTPAREASVFDLTAAVSEGRHREALRLLRELLAQGEEPLVLLALLHRQHRRLLLARWLSERGAGEGEAARELGLPPWAARRAMVQARRLPLSRLRAAYRRLLEADAAIKRGKMAPEVALETLVYDLAALGAG
ncbi:MAG TPA: DNA polymerase III subunit delta [Dehalococcoidia bacterium]|nr:DNA polymerase III subunit delta [Dehalococcoidia bacterium]